MANATGHDTLYIGLGNPYRQDDGVGTYVVRALAADPRPGMQTAIDIGDSLQLLSRMQGYRSVMLIDAMKAGTSPGLLQRFDGHGNRWRDAAFAVSSHVLGLGEAIDLGRRLQNLPPDLTILGIEGQQFDFGIGLSPAVRACADTLISELTARHSVPAA